MSWRRRLTLALSESILPSARRSCCSCSHGLVPIEHTSRGVQRAHDIFSSLLKKRIVCINGPISHDTASVVVPQLFFLESENPSNPIHLYLNSPEDDDDLGAVTAGLTIYDTIQYIRPPVSTLCLGRAASMGSLLLAAGAPGERRAFPNSRVRIKVGYSLQDHREIFKVSKRLNEIYSRHTGQSIQRIKQCIKRDKFMSPYEAKEFGLVDEVIEHRPLALVTDAVPEKGAAAANEGTKSESDDGNGIKEQK